MIRTLLKSATILFSASALFLASAGAAMACSDAGTASASVDSVCYNDPVVLSTTGYLGTQFQWQSFNGTAWINETGPGFNTDTYNISISVTTDFRVIVTETGCPSDTSNTVTVTVGTVPVPTAQNVTRCGPGFVNLTGTGSGNLQWFTDPSATTPFATGNNVNTFVGASTTLYVADQVLGGSGANSPILITEMEVTTNDVLEIQNVGPVPVDVTGWKVALSDSYTDINLANVIIQTLSGTMNPGDIMTWSDGGVGTAWGNNIFWAAGNFPGFAGWAIILDAQDNVMDFVAMNWPAANIQSMSVNIGGATVTPGTIWSGDGVSIVGASAGLSIQRNGSSDNNSLTDFTIQSVSSGLTNPLITLPFTGFGCNSPLVPVTVTITPSDPVTINASSTGFCLSGSATLTATSNNPNYTYTWSPATGLNTTTGATVVSTPPGFGDITYVVIGDDGNCSNVDSVTISVGQPTTAGTASTFQDTICLGKDTDLLLTGSFGNIQWQSLSAGNWVNESGPGSNSAVYTVAPTVNTTYRAYLTSGSCPPDSSNIIDITVQSISDPVTADTSLCAGGTVTLNATGQGTLTWYQTPTSSATVNSGTSFTVTTSQTVTYYVQALIGSEYNVGPPTNGFGNQTASAGNNTGLQFDVVRPVTIDFVHIYPNATGTVTINLRQSLGGPILATHTQNVQAFSGKTEVPLGFVVPVGTGYRLEMAAGSASCAQNTSGAVYPYTVANGPVNITGYVNPNPASGGIYLYFYDWIVSEGCRSNRIPATITVNPFPSIPTISQNNNILTSSSPVGNQWYLNGNPIPGATDQTLVLTQTGNYTVVVTINGCSTTSAVFQVTTIGLNELDESLLSVYPNPVSNELNISVVNSSEEFSRLLITDITGRNIRTMEIPRGSTQLTVNTSDLMQGIYMIELTSGQSVVRRRFVIER